MEIQSNTAASTLFDGLAQSTTQGAGAKDDMFSKMMERMLSDAATRKREQADAAARDSAKDAAREARDAKADAQRKAPIRAERPRFDSTPPLREPMRAEPPAPRAADAKASDRAPDRADDKTAAADGKDGKDAARATADEPARKTAKTDKPAAKDATTATKDAEPNADAATDTAESGDPTAETVSADPTDESADAQAGTEEQAADAQTTILDVALTITETTVEIATPTSDALLASLQASGATAQPVTAATDTAMTAAPADSEAATAPVAQAAADPAAQLASQLAQAQQAATQAAGQTAQAKTAAPLADPIVPAEATGDGKAAEALPTDDETALPTGFADLIAAAKAKIGEKSGAKQTGADSGGKNDGQPQAQTTPFQAAPAAPGPVAASLKSAAEGQAVGALTGTEATAPAAAAQHAPGSQTHAALAGMEAPHAAAPIDAPQATATLRPSRGSAGMPLGVPEQLSVHIKKNVADDIDQFTINLHPAELGRIDIKLDIGADGRVSAMVAVEKAQTLELLQRDSRNLEKALQDAGLKADSDSLNFSLRGEGNPFQGEGNGSGKRGRGGRGGGEPDPAEAVAYTVTLGEGRVDIRA